MTVNQLTLEKFTAFENRVTFEFSPGINVLVGQNSSGKTHALKALYTLLWVCNYASQNPETVNKKSDVEAKAKDKLFGVFLPDTLGRLVRRQTGRKSAEIKIVYDQVEFGLSISTQQSVKAIYEKGEIPSPPLPIFIPPHEVLTIASALRPYQGVRNKQFLDDTYLDLATSLEKDLQPGRPPAETSRLIRPLANVLKDSDIKRLQVSTGKDDSEPGTNKFYINMPEGSLEATLVAEGYRKLGGLLYLIRNGNLSNRGILIWDEPEANLNPKLMVAVIKLLVNLADYGVQIFLSTHDFLISHELSLLAEYGKRKDLRFFALSRSESRQGAALETANSMVELENNPILEEMVAHYDREAELINEKQD